MHPEDVLIQSNGCEVRFQIHEAAGEEQVGVDPARKLKAGAIEAFMFAVWTRGIVVLRQSECEDDVP
jgi:hypothetical protein